MRQSLLQMEDDLEEWDVKRSLFDDHMAGSMQSNLEYMWKKFGFYFPEADLLADPEGLLKYLVSSDEAKNGPNGPNVLLCALEGSFLPSWLLCCHCRGL